jgi:DNA-binding MarR family transcriptional regulator
MSTQRPSPSRPTGDLDCAESAAWVGLLRTHASLVRALDDEMQSGHGISLTQYEVLLLLSRSETGALRMNELADGALLSLSGLSRLVDRLVALGLVERAQCPTDRRGAFAVVTPAGRKRFAAARPTHLDGVRRRFIDVLPPETVAMLASAWDAVATAQAADTD